MSSAGAAVGATKRTLFPHQEEAVEWFLRTERETERGGILADEMGLGKTTSALVAFHRD
jgi:SNF2 family DNA or RNA helicase